MDWLARQAQLKLWLIHHGFIRTAFEVQRAVDTHYLALPEVTVEDLQEIFAMNIKLAHDRLMGDDY